MTDHKMTGRTFSIELAEPNLRNRAAAACGLPSHIKPELTLTTKAHFNADLFVYPIDSAATRKVERICHNYKRLIIAYTDRRGRIRKSEYTCKLLLLVPARQNDILRSHPSTADARRLMLLFHWMMATDVPELALASERFDPWMIVDRIHWCLKQARAWYKQERMKAKLQA